MKHIFSAVAIASVGLTSSAHAQVADGSQPASDIIVTARRVEERLHDVPISLTVYGQEAISDRNIVNTAELATYTPSLSINARFGPEKASFAIRGFVQDAGTEPSVGTYFADVVGPRGASTTAGGDGVGVGNMFDLQNVQVLKGPQGTLFGRNTTGGAVLLVPNKPTDKLEGYIEGSAGSYDMWRLQGVINVPLADTFKVRLGIDRMKREGYLKNHSGIGPDRLANTDYIAARLSILADLTPELENYTIATYSDSDNKGTIPRVLTCKRPDFTKANPFDGFASLQFLGGTFGCAQVDRQNARGDGWWDVENSDPNPRLHVETWQVINTTTWSATDNLTVKNIASYAERREDTNFNIYGDYWTNQNGSFFRPSLLIDTTPGYHYGSESTMTEELQLQGKNGRLTWQAGGYMERSDPIGYGSQSVPVLLNCSDLATLSCTRGFSLTVPLPGGGTVDVPVSNLGRPFYKRWWRSYGLYGQGTYSVTDKLSVTAGIRYTWDTARHYQANVNMLFLADNTPTPYCSNTIRNPGPGGGQKFFANPNDFHQCDLEFSKNSSAPTWVIDAEYKPADDVMIYAKWSRGYRAGGVATPYVFYETWDPEKVDAYEIGAKASFRGSVSGYLNIAGFYNNFTNQQIQTSLIAKTGAPATDGTAIINAGRSRIWGVEVDSSLTFFDSLRLEAGYTYLNTKVLELTGIPPEDNVIWTPGTSPWRLIKPSAVAGGELSFSPKHRAQITGTYALPVRGSIGKIDLGATFVYTAKQIASINTPYGPIPATKLLNINVNWKDFMGQPLDLSFFMTNVTQAKFPVHLGTSYDSFGFESALVNEPRMWGFRLRYRFDE